MLLLKTYDRMFIKRDRIEELICIADHSIQKIIDYLEKDGFNVSFVNRDNTIYVSKNDHCVASIVDTRIASLAYQYAVMLEDKRTSFFLFRKYTDSDLQETKGELLKKMKKYGTKEYEYIDKKKLVKTYVFKIKEDILHEVKL